MCLSSPISVIVDAREWKHFKELTQTVTPLEEDMFHLPNSLAPQIYLRPKETVHIPFKYQASCTEQTTQTQVEKGSLPGLLKMLHTVPRRHVLRASNFRMSQCKDSRFMFSHRRNVFTPTQAL